MNNLVIIEGSNDTKVGKVSNSISMRSNTTRIILILDIMNVKATMERKSLRSRYVFDKLFVYLGPINDRVPWC